MKTRKNRSIFRMILSSMLAILCIEILLLVGILYFSNMTERLNRNACNLLDTQTSNRQTYLQSTLVKNNNLTELSDKLDSALLELMDSGSLQLSDLDRDDDKCAALLQAVSDDLISTLRQKEITGLFVVLNTRDLDTLDADTPLTGIYLRDLDPDAAPSERNADLLLERSPIQLVQSMFISTSKNWQPTILRGPDTTAGFIYPAFETAYLDHASLDENDYGHLTTSTYTLSGDPRSAVAYSVPLILPDGTVYGVLGVEMLSTYLQQLLPSDELENGQEGMYFFAYTEHLLTDETIPLQIVAASGHSGPMENESVTLTTSGEDHWLEWNGRTYYTSMQLLSVYNRNAPFSNEHWYLVSAVPAAQLFSFSREIVYILALAIFLTIVIGIFCSFFVSRRLAHPISKMSEEAAAAQHNPNNVPVFSPTHIKELEQFSSSISKLSQDIVNTSTKFLRIMDMASIEIGGYEIRHDTGSVYVTDNFFSLLGIEDKRPTTDLVPEHFISILKEFDESCPHMEYPSVGKLYRVALPDGNIRYLHMKETVVGHAQIGIAEDETAATMERMRIEYERDFDALTNIYNRRAFHRIYQSLFQAPQILKHAALIMLDLDNLKYINDTFGHDYGDEYIRHAGQCMTESLPSTALYAHISGDEFMIFLYGYDSDKEIMDVVDNFKYTVRRHSIQLPDGTARGISISGGISWYPENTTDPSVLKTYADFAMYQIKQSSKGAIGVFDPEIYQQKIYVENLRREFYQVIHEEKLDYHFQPIVSALDGSVYAYEALMRVNMPVLKGPGQVLQVAREESCLHDVERLTVFKASEAFVRLKKDGHIRGDELLFLNSISSQYLTDEESREYIARYSDLQDQLVVEVTESENLDPEILERKRHFPGFKGIFALDDYGSGYSNEKTLLSLSPHYIKLDISIIHSIDTDVSKQQLASYIISYAHLHDIQIIAEGIETSAELLKVLELGADLLQGYYLARPAAVPEAIDPEAVKYIHKFQKAHRTSVKN